MSTDRRAFSIGPVLASLVAALALLPLGIWARHLEIGGGVVPVVDSTGRAYWLVGLALALALGGLFQRLDRNVDLPTAWVVPFVSILTATMLLAIYDSLAAIVCVLLGVFVTLAVAAISRQVLFRSDGALHEQARGLSTIIIHVVAFFALSMIYVNKLPGRYAAPAVFLVALLLLLEITDGEPDDVVRRLIYGFTGGVVLGEMTWILGYWDATGWTGGATLLVFFYLSAGLILAQVRQGVKRRDILEYGSVSLFAFAIVMYSLFR